jgi:hypothetical protein
VPETDVLVAFFTGIGAVFSAVVSLNLSRRRYRKECAERIEEVKLALQRGYEMGRG